MPRDAGPELPTLYARRGYGWKNGGWAKTTFVSWDEADDQPAGHTPGWFEDGAVIDHNGAHRLVHVYTRSWRCEEPQRLPAEKASKAQARAAA